MTAGSGVPISDWGIHGSSSSGGGGGGVGVEPSRRVGKRHLISLPL